MPQRNRGDRPPKNPSVKLEFTEPEKVDDGTYKSLVTFFAKRGNEPMGDVEVQVYVDDSQYGNVVGTDDNGRGSMDVAGLAPGTHRFATQIVGTATSDSKVVHIARPEKKESRPDKILVRRLGGDGAYTIQVVILDQAKAPKSNVLVEVFDERGRGGTKIGSGMTNEHGDCEIKVIVPPEYDNRVLHVKVLVRGTEYERSIPLYGRKVEKDPYVPTCAPRYMRGTGFRAGFSYRSRQKDQEEGK